MVFLFLFGCLGLCAWKMQQRFVGLRLDKLQSRFCVIKVCSLRFLAVRGVKKVDDGYKLD